MTDDPLPVDPPGPRALDVQAALLKSALSYVPFAGNVLTQFVELALAPLLQARRDDWLRKLAERVNKLSEQGRLTPEQLVDNEAFATAFLTATQAALRTHHAAKREALRNAVLNVALGNTANEQLQSMFIAMIDRFTPWHLGILTLFRNPEAHELAAERLKLISSGGRSDILEAAYPELRGQRLLYDPIVRELFSAGLLSVDNLNTTISSSGLAQRVTTDLGDAFVKFISSPVGSET